MQHYAMALSTVGNHDTARKLARVIVEERAAACVTIIAKVLSCYKWKGDLCEEEEYLLIIKTRLDKQKSIEDLFRAYHPYEVPELIFFPIEAGKTEYLAWIDECLTTTRRPGEVIE